MKTLNADPELEGLIRDLSHLRRTDTEGWAEVRPVLLRVIQRTRRKLQGYRRARAAA
jgi:hypothetical protein